MPTEQFNYMDLRSIGMVGLVTTEFPEGQKHNEIDSYFMAINPAKHTETDSHHNLNIICMFVQDLYIMILDYGI